MNFVNNPNAHHILTLWPALGKHRRVPESVLAPGRALVGHVRHF